MDCENTIMVNESTERCSLKLPHRRKKPGSRSTRPDSVDIAKVRIRPLKKKLTAVRRRQVKRKNEWTGIIKVVAILAASKLLCMSITDHFSIYGMYSLAKVPGGDMFWCTVVLGIVFVRCFSTYFVSKLGMPLLLEIAWIVPGETLCSLITFKYIRHTAPKFWMDSISILCWLKLFSFLIRSRSTNISLGDFSRFVSYPVIEYRYKYATKAKRSWASLGISALKFIIFFILILIMIDSDMIPTVKKILATRSKFSRLTCFIHLGVSSAATFNLAFRVMFEGFLSTISELTLYNEKLSNEWWSATTSSEFWRDWNLPIHDFIKQHIYKPTMQAGLSKTVAMGVSFLASGIVHEYVVSMALGGFSGWFLLAMLMQLPLHFCTAAVKRHAPNFAGVFFWTCFSGIGQPLLMILIYRDS